MDAEIQAYFDAEWRTRFAFDEILKGNRFTADLALEGLLGIVSDTTSTPPPSPDDKWNALKRAVVHVLPHTSYAPDKADEAKKKALAQSIASVTTTSGVLMVQERANLDFAALEGTRFHFGFRPDETFVQFRERFRNAIEDPVHHTGYAVDMHHQRDEAGAVIRAYVEAKGGDGTVSEEIRRYDRAYQRKMATLHHLEAIANDNDRLLQEYGRYHHHRFLHYTDHTAEDALDTGIQQVTARGALSARQYHRQLEADLKKTRLEQLKADHKALKDWKASWLGTKTGWSWTKRAWIRSTWLKDKAIQALLSVANIGVSTVNVGRSTRFVGHNRILRPWRWSPRRYLSSRRAELHSRAQEASQEIPALTAILTQHATPDLEARAWNTAGTAMAMSSQEHALQELLAMIDNRTTTATNPAQAQSLLPADYRNHLTIEDQEVYDALAAVYNHSAHNQNTITNTTLATVTPAAGGVAAWNVEHIRTLWQNLHPVRQPPAMPEALLTFAHMIMERGWTTASMDRPDQVLGLLRYANAIIRDLSTPINLPGKTPAPGASH